VHNSLDVNHKKRSPSAMGRENVYHKETLIKGRNFLKRGIYSTSVLASRPVFPITKGGMAGGTPHSLILLYKCCFLD
jgi:hypothetical protein